MLSDQEEVDIVEAGRTLNLALFDRLVEPDSVALAYTYPVNSSAEYRGWYRVTSGPDAGKALWAPKWSKYKGPRPSGPHGGSDLFGVSGTAVLAVTAGQIEWRPFHPTWGNHIYLYHAIGGERLILVYAHLDPSGTFDSPKPVTAGAEVGKIGCTGNAGNAGACWRDTKCNGKLSVEDHLHLELLVLDTQGAVLGKKDAVAIYGWTVAFADDTSETICGSQSQQLPS